MLYVLSSVSCQDLSQIMDVLCARMSTYSSWLHELENGSAARPFCRWVQALLPGCPDLLCWCSLPISVRGMACACARDGMCLCEPSPFLCEL